MKVIWNETLDITNALSDLSRIRLTNKTGDINPINSMQLDGELGNKDTWRWYEPIFKDAIFYTTGTASVDNGDSIIAIYDLEEWQRAHIISLSGVPGGDGEAVRCFFSAIWCPSGTHVARRMAACTSSGTKR